MTQTLATTAEHLPAETRSRVASAIAASKAPATRRAYRAAWTLFAAWCDTHGLEVLPAAPGTLAGFLADRAASGSGTSSLRTSIAAVAAAHELAGHASPGASPLVKTTMQGLVRQAAAAGAVARQAKALTSEAVAAVRGHLNGKVESDRRAAVTMAIVSTMADAGLRRSEAAALRWGDIAIEGDGSGRLTVRTSKTDATGEGAVVAITEAAVSDLDRIRPAGADPDASVFELGDRQIARRIATVAKAAGLGDGYGGHSGRVGMAQRMTTNGAAITVTMQQGRWDSTRMVARYTRAITAGEALRYL